MIIVINLKTYKEATGKAALKLAKSLPKDKSIILSVQTADIKMISQLKKFKIYSQHADFQEQGRNTGFTIIEDLQAQGAQGTLLNHSEHRIPRIDMAETLYRGKKKKFKIILCVESIEETKEILRLEPEMIAFEIPELISTGKSISSVMPEKVREFSKIISDYNKKNNKKIKALCGAGILTAEDVKASIKLGCDGVLASSAIVKSKNPKKLLKEMLAKNA